MVRQATVEERNEAGRNQNNRGTIERAGRRADEIVGLLRAEGYEVRVKKLVPGAEAKLTLEIAYGAESTLFD